MGDECFCVQHSPPLLCDVDWIQGELSPILKTGAALSPPPHLIRMGCSLNDYSITICYSEQIRAALRSLLLTADVLWAGFT